MAQENNKHIERSLESAFLEAQSMYKLVRNPKLEFSVDQAVAETFMSLSNKHWRKMVLQIFVAIAHLDQAGSQSVNVTLSPGNRHSMAFWLSGSEETKAITLNDIEVHW